VHDEAACVYRLTEQHKCDGTCKEGFVVDCSGDGDCCAESWIGDRFPDCADQAFGCDLSCYNLDNNSCVKPGCMDETACNYDFLATEDDGSCKQEGDPEC